MNDFQKEMVEQLRKFRLDKIEPFMEEDDQNSNFRMEIYQELGQLGLTGITMPEKYSGAGLQFTDQIYALRELAKTSVSYATTLSVSSMVQTILYNAGNDTQKDKYLPALTTGVEIGAFALTETSAGSDASSLKTRAKKTDGGYILTGNKMFCTSGGIAKTYIVMARTGEGKKGISAFIVRDGAKGFSYGKLESKMGWKVSPTRELIFDKCFVPDEDLLKAEGEGLKVALTGLDKGRISIAAIAVGLAQRCIEESTKYSLERQQFDQSIFEFQGIKFMLADMMTECEAANQLVLNAARLYDDGENSSMFSSMAKLKATEMAMKVSTDAVQILGGVGYTSEYPLERYMRDAKGLQIVEGSNQIQKVLIARGLQKLYQTS
jgi:butyryl-CoA dehydrogenase